MNAALLTARSAAPDIARPLRTAAAVVGFGLVGFGLWAGQARLDAAAIAPGFVRVETDHKVVQHREGGIVREILVREGQEVRAGDVLIRLVDVDTSSELALLEAQRDAALAEEARLLAERDGAAEIAFPPDLAARAADPAVSALMSAERRLFASRRDGLAGKRAILDRKEAQLGAQVDAARRQVGAVDAQLALVRAEAATVQAMVDKGWERKPRVAAAQRAIAALEADKAELEGRIAEAGESIAETRLQAATLGVDERSAAGVQLAAVRQRLATVRERLLPAADQQSRREILAPADGRVFDLRVTTPGAVLPPGAEVLAIVPSGDRLTIDARLDPTDIDVVHEGQAARVRLTAFRQRVTPTLEGTVTQISADALVDRASGRPYYLAKVTLGGGELARAGIPALVPGMPAEVMIDTGARTLLDYLLAPLTDGMAHAMREG